MTGIGLEARRAGRRDDGAAATVLARAFQERFVVAVTERVPFEPVELWGMLRA